MPFCSISVRNPCEYNNTCGEGGTCNGTRNSTETECICHQFYHGDRCQRCTTTVLCQFLCFLCGLHRLQGKQPEDTSDCLAFCVWNMTHENGTTRIIQVSNNGTELPLVLCWVILHCEGIGFLACGAPFVHCIGICMTLGRH